MLSLRGPWALSLPLGLELSSCSQLKSWRQEQGHAPRAASKQQAQSLAALRTPALCLEEEGEKGMRAALWTSMGHQRTTGYAWPLLGRCLVRAC